TSSLVIRRGVLPEGRQRKLGFMIANEDSNQAGRFFVARVGEYLVHAIWRFIKILASLVDGLGLSFDFVPEGSPGDVTNHCARMAVRRRRLARRYFDIGHKQSEMVAIHGRKLMRISRFGWWGTRCGICRALSAQVGSQHS